MDGVKTQSKNMNSCHSCNKHYKHKRSLDRHIKETHIQMETTEVAKSQPEEEYENSMRGFVLQYFGFWGCHVDQFPAYLPESIRILIRETKALHNRVHELLRTMCIVITKESSADKKVLIQFVDDMFQDDVYNWGRIISLFAMAIELSEHAKTNNLHEVDNAIPDMLVHALRKADDWIQNQGGWNAFAYMFY